MAGVFESLGQFSQALSDRGGVDLEFVDPGIPLSDYAGEGGLGAGSAWRSQPSVRKVVDFIARNVATIPLRLYERAGDNDRQRVHDDPVAETIRKPHPTLTPFRFWHAVLTDGLLWDRWALLKVTDQDGRLWLQRIPARRFRVVADGMDQPLNLVVYGADGRARDVGLEQVVFDAGYATRGAGGTSPILTIKTVLEEAAEAVNYRRQIWKNGVRVPGFILRDRPWSSDTARERFSDGLRRYARGGSDSGSLAVLSDGMKFQEAQVFAPKDTADLEGRRLADVEVASFYHIAPELVGAREGNYSNLEAFRQMLWNASLGPYIEAWEQAVDFHLSGAMGSTNRYVEAYLEAKLRGSFQEQASIMQSATGAPWLTRNEARTLQNRPPIDGADELVLPLNVIIGGQASPNDTAPPPKAARRIVGEKSRPARHVEAHQRLLTAFFTRQKSSVFGKIGADPSGDWWDSDRWDRELAGDLARLGVLTSSTAGRSAAAQLGFGDGDFDEDRTLAWISEACRRLAVGRNDYTRRKLAEAVALAGADPLAGARDAWAKFGPDPDVMAVELVTFMAGFGTVEAGRQLAPAAVKVWRASPDARPAHAVMDGEERGLDEDFSNGQRFPGQGTDPAEIAGCRCSVDVEIPT